MFTGLMLIAWSVTGQLIQPPSADLKQEIRSLVRQLDSDELARRNEAEEALIEKGPVVLDLLPEPSDRTSAEVRERLARIRQKLQQAVVRSATKPSLITLHGDDVPLSKILDAFRDQSGNRIIDYRPQFNQPADDPLQSVQFHQMPFWQALDQVLDTAGLTIYPYADEPGINFVYRGPGQLLRAQTAVYSGPFRFEPTRLIAQRDFSDPTASSLRLTLNVAWEPRLKPIVLTQPLADLSAVDDRGRALQVQSDQAEIEAPVDGMRSAIDMALPFNLPPRDAKKIASLKGKLSAMVPGRIEVFTFGDLLKAKNVEKRQAGVTVTLDLVRQNNEAWEVFVRVRFDQPGDALASHRGWIFRNEAYLETADGKRVDYDTMETTRQTQEEVGVDYIFMLDKPPADMKFIYKTPGAILNATFPYELRDLQLP